MESEINPQNKNGFDYEISIVEENIKNRKRRSCEEGNSTKWNIVLNNLTFYPLPIFEYPLPIFEIIIQKPEIFYEK